MIKTLTLKSTSPEHINGTLKKLDLSYLPQIMDLQTQIVEGLSEPSWYSPTSEEEFKTYISQTGYLLGCVTDSNVLVALGVYVNPKSSEDNYGHDIGLTEDALLKVGHIEITIVRQDFRGNHLQQILCECLEEIALQYRTPYMMATVSPDNIYSLNTLKKLGYEVKKEKLKYGGLKRYILFKHL